MREHVLALFTTFLLLIPIVSRSQIYYGTTSGIAKAKMANDLKESFLLLGQVRREKAVFEKEVKSARTNYWNSFPKVSSSATQKYLKALQEKDNLYIYIKIVEYETNNFTRDLGFGTSDISKLFDMVAGGEIDGGIDEMAKYKFNNWVSSVIDTYAQVKNTKSRNEAIKYAIEKNKDLYAEYVERRNYHEILRYSPKSPFSSNDDLEVFISCRLAISEYDSYEDCVSDYNLFIKQFGKDSFHKGIELFRAKNFSYLNDSKKVIDSMKYNSMYIYDYIGLVSPEIYAVNLFREGYGLGLMDAVELFNRRVAKYGKKKVLEASNSTMIEQKVSRAKFKLALTRRFFNDFNSSFGGREVQINDLYHLSRNINQDSVKKELFKTYTRAQGQDFIKSYSNYVKYVPEDLLLRAHYVANRYYSSCKDDYDELEFRRYLMDFLILNENYNVLTPILLGYNRELLYLYMDRTVESFIKYQNSPVLSDANKRTVKDIVYKEYFSKKCGTYIDFFKISQYIHDRVVSGKSATGYGQDNSSKYSDNSSLPANGFRDIITGSIVPFGTDVKKKMNVVVFFSIDSKQSLTCLNELNTNLKNLHMNYPFMFQAVCIDDNSREREVKEFAIKNKWSFPCFIVNKGEFLTELREHPRKRFIHINIENYKTNAQVATTGDRDLVNRVYTGLRKLGEVYQ